MELKEMDIPLVKVLQPLKSDIFYFFMIKLNKVESAHYISQIINFPFSNDIQIFLEYYQTFSRTYSKRIMFIYSIFLQ